MKLKGISWIEAHFEKVFVGLMAVVLLAVLVMQFVLQSNRVSVDGQNLPLNAAYGPSERQAESLLAQMDARDPAIPALSAGVDIADAFATKLTEGVSPTDRIQGFGTDVAAALSGDTGQVAGNAFAAFEPPAPAAPIVAAYRATLDPYAIRDIEGITSIIPPQQPYDTAWITVQTSLDPAALKAAYENDPDGAAGEIQRLRTDWWREKVGVLAMEVERQTAQPDGTWGEPVMVASLPGDEPVIDLTKTPANWRELDTLATVAARAEDVVLRPEFFPILEGQPWLPPSEVPAPEDIESNEAQIRVLERRLSRIERDIESKEQAISDGGRQPGDREGGRGEIGGGHGGNQPEAQPGTPSGEDPRTRSIRRQIERLEQQLEQVRQELADLGWQDDGDDELVVFDPSEWRTEGELLEADALHAWRHDAEVRDGAQYRYRVRMVMANPLFGRQATLSDELDPLAEQAFTRTPWSEWSEPVTIGWPEYFFVERASQGNDFSPASARAELYKFYYGYWRVASVGLTPGDRFVGEIDLPDGLQSWDIERSATEQAWVQGEDAEQPDGLELMPEEISVEADAWLLDVVPSPFGRAGIGGQTEQRIEALIRGPDGMISRRTPELERSTPIYRLVRSSALEGEQQLPTIPGQGRRRAVQPEPGRDVRDQPIDRWDPGPGGGHGGHGGGGGGGGGG